MHLTKPEMDHLSATALVWKRIEESEHTGDERDLMRDLRELAVRADATADELALRVGKGKP